MARNTNNSDSILGLWSTDGTTNGTTLYTNYDGQFPNPVADVHSINGSLYFRYYNGTAYTYGQMNNAAGAIIGQPQLVDFAFPPCRPELWYQQRHDLGNADSVEHDYVVQHHGDERQRQFNHEHQHHHQRSVAVAFLCTGKPHAHEGPIQYGFATECDVDWLGTVTSWEINATLPAGLNFGTSNGTIWGIPTALQTTTTTYTIWANNSGGSVLATINITINDEASWSVRIHPREQLLDQQFLREHRAFVHQHHHG